MGSERFGRFPFEAAIAAVKTKALPAICGGQGRGAVNAGADPKKVIC